MDNAVTYVPASERVDRAKVPRKAVLMVHWLKYPPVHQLIIMLDTMKDCDLIDRTILEQVLGVLCLK